MSSGVVDMDRLLGWGSGTPRQPQQRRNTGGQPSASTHRQFRLRGVLVHPVPPGLLGPAAGPHRLPPRPRPVLAQHGHRADPEAVPVGQAPVRQSEHARVHLLPRYRCPAAGPDVLVRGQPGAETGVHRAGWWMPAPGLGHGRCLEVHSQRRRLVWAEYMRATDAVRPLSRFPPQTARAVRRLKSSMGREAFSVVAVPLPPLGRHTGRPCLPLQLACSRQTRGRFTGTQLDEGQPAASPWRTPGPDAVPACIRAQRTGTWVHAGPHPHRIPAQVLPWPLRTLIP